LFEVINLNLQEQRVHASFKRAVEIRYTANIEVELLSRKDAAV